MRCKRCGLCLELFDSYLPLLQQDPEWEEELVQRVVERIHPKIELRQPTDQDQEKQKKVELSPETEEKLREVINEVIDKVLLDMKWTENWAVGLCSRAHPEQRGEAFEQCVRNFKKLALRKLITPDKRQELIKKIEQILVDKDLCPVYKELCLAKASE